MSSNYQKNIKNIGREGRFSKVLAELGYELSNYRRVKTQNPTNTYKMIISKLNAEKAKESVAAKRMAEGAAARREAAAAANAEKRRAAENSSSSLKAMSRLLETYKKTLNRKQLNLAEKNRTHQAQLAEKNRNLAAKNRTHQAQLAEKNRNLAAKNRQIKELTNKLRIWETKSRREAREVTESAVNIGRVRERYAN